MEQPEILFEINKNIEQRFVHMTNDEGRDYLVSLPKEKAQFHNDIAIYANDHFGKKLNPRGGGKIRLSNNTFYLSDKSTAFGDFDKEKVVVILKKAYPESSVVLE